MLRVAVACTLTCAVTGSVLVAAALPSSAASSIELPTPAASKVQQDQLIKAVGGLPDRLLASDVPGTVVNDELVRVGLSGDGGVVAVTADQRLSLRGTGDYAIRERGPARSATSLGDGPPPVTRRGAVVWQGFSPGRRDLAARLVLDAGLEQARLPVLVSIRFRGADGREAPLGPGGVVPAAGTVQVTVRNATGQPQDLPTGGDVDPLEIAPLLDRALAVARRPGPGRLPSTDAGLPARLRVLSPAVRSSVQSVPYRLTGSLQLEGTTGTVTGPGTTAGRDGAAVSGTLGGSGASNARAEVTFEARTDGPGRLSLDLHAVSTLNAAELAPPRGLPTWTAWAASGPEREERRAALDLLVAVAATGARASSFSPYLGADLEGTGTTAFRFAFAPPPAVQEQRPELEPRWGPIGLAGLGLLALIGLGVVVWRRS